MKCASISLLVNSLHRVQHREYKSVLLDFALAGGAFNLVKLLSTS